MNKYHIIIIISMLVSCQFFKKEEDNETSSDPIDQEIAAYSKRILDSPKNAYLYYKRGLLYWEQKVNERALADFYKMTTYDSTKPIYFETLAEFFVDNLNIERGIAALDIAIRLDPGNPKYHVLQGKYCIYVKKYQEAINHLNNALKRDIHNPEAYLYKAIVYRESKNIPKAISNLITATEQDPTWDQPFEILGEIYAEKKDDICLKYFDNAALVNKQNTSALNQKAFYLQGKNKMNEAAKIYEQMVVQNPQNSDALYNLGVVNYKLKNYKEAMHTLEICIQVEPTHALAYYMIGKTELALGNKNKAREAFHQASIFDTTMVEAKAELAKF